jgi:hypothetical protein
MPVASRRKPAGESNRAGGYPKRARQTRTSEAVGSGRLDDDQKGIISVDTLGGAQQMPSLAERLGKTRALKSRVLEKT